MVLAACGAGGPPAPARATINEILAHNLHDAVDEAGEHEDWLELFNPGEEAADLSGWTLVDELGEGSHWSFPTGTVLDPGDFLVLWCDATPEQGPLHTSFQLAADGESLLLFDADGVLVEETRYAMLFFDESWARVPDGADRWQIPARPTPGRPNGAE